MDAMRWNFAHLEPPFRLRRVVGSEWGVREMVVGKKREDVAARDLIVFGPPCCVAPLDLIVLSSRFHKRASPYCDRFGCLGTLTQRVSSAYILFVFLPLRPGTWLVGKCRLAVEPVLQCHAFPEKFTDNGDTILRIMLSNLLIH